MSLAGAASVEFGLCTGSGRLFQADGPALEKVRRLDVLSQWRSTCKRFRSGWTTINQSKSQD